jgi:WD40 repeat protein
LAGAVPPTARPEVVANPHEFLVPARAVVYEKKATVEDNEVTAWVKRGGVLTAKVNVGLFFVEAGGTLEISGNCYRIVVAEGGTVSAVVGNVIHIYRAKGAKVGKINATIVHGKVHESITFRQSDKFAVTGMVRGANGKPAPGVKVHAYTLGNYFLMSQTTDAEGRYTITTDEEVTSLAADLSPRWSDEKRLGRGNTDLEIRQRLGALQGWDMPIAHGPWSAKAVVDLAPRGPAKLKMQEVHSLPPVPSSQSVYPELRFSPDGTLLVVLLPEIDMVKAEAQIWDVGAGKQMVRFPLKPARTVYGDWAAFSADGKRLALVGPEAIGVYRVSGGDKLAELPLPAGEPWCLAFSPDGSLLAMGGEKDIGLYDIARKTVRRRLKGHEAGTSHLTFSPDGKALVSAGYVWVVNDNFTVQMSERLRLWEPATGAERDCPPGQEGRLLFAPGGLLVSAGHTSETKQDGDTLSTRTEESISVVNLATRQELIRLKEKGHAAVVTADGRFLVTAGRGGLVYFWELLTGEAVLAVPIPEYWTPALELAPGGRALATSRQDGSVLLWDLRWDRIRVSQEPPVFNEVEQDRAWNDLGGPAGGAYDVVWSLSKAPAPALAFLKQRLKPAPVPDLPIKQWLADLGSPEFKVREAGTRELLRQGRRVEPTVREALRTQPPLEERRRLEEILSTLARQPFTGEELRQVRGIVVLEWIGTPEARQVLRTLAAGWADALHTREAAAALRRLER